MPQTIITLAAILLTAGCHQESPPTERHRAQAALAIAEAEQPDPKQPQAQPVQKPDERPHRVLYFGAKSCPACREAEQFLDKLADAGWQVGHEPDNHIQIVTIDASDKQRARARRWNVTATPTWILAIDDTEHKRVTGPLDPFAIARLYKNTNH